MTNTTDPGWSDEVVAHVRRLWGDQLRPVDPARIHPGLSAATRGFLTDVGLPDFEPTGGFESVRDQTDRILSRDGRDYVVVGGICARRGFLMLFGIDVGTDQVFKFHPEKTFRRTGELTGEPVLMNTTVALWVLFLGVYEQEMLSQVGVIEPYSAEADALYKRIKTFLTAMDPEGMRYKREQNWHGCLRGFFYD